MYVGVNTLRSYLSPDPTITNWGLEDRVKLKGPPVRHGEAGATPCVLYESKWTCPTVLSAR